LCIEDRTLGGQLVAIHADGVTRRAISRIGRQAGDVASTVPAADVLERGGCEGAKTSLLDAAPDDPRSGAEPKQADGLRGWCITHVASSSARA